MQGVARCRGGLRRADRRRPQQPADGPGRNSRSPCSVARRRLLTSFDAQPRRQTLVAAIDLRGRYREPFSELGGGDRPRHGGAVAWRSRPVCRRSRKPVSREAGQGHQPGRSRSARRRCSAECSKRRSVDIDVASRSASPDGRADLESLAAQLPELRPYPGGADPPDVDARDRPCFAKRGGSRRRTVGARRGGLAPSTVSPMPMHVRETIWDFAKATA